MKFLRLSIIILSLLVVSNLQLSSQIDSTVKPITIDKSDISDTNASKKTYTMSKSPSGAIWRSLALPGWGQLYVESYWKAPLFFAGAGTLIYFIIDNNSKYVDYDNRMIGMKKTDPQYENLKLYREFYRDNRDMSGFYLLAVYILATVDAYVGAHLYDFQVDENLSMNFEIFAAPVPTVSFTIRF